MSPRLCWILSENLRSNGCQSLPDFFRRGFFSHLWTLAVLFDIIKRISDLQQIQKEERMLLSWNR